jgi:hypothetical protein
MQRGRKLVGQTLLSSEEHTATLIEPDGGPDGDPVFGPEIRYADWRGVRSFFRRRDGRLDEVSLPLWEVRFGSEVAHQFGLAVGRTELMIAESPPSTRVVRLPLRPGTRRLGPVVFDDLYDLPPPFHSDDDVAAASDEVAARLLVDHSPYPFSAEDGLFAALRSNDPTAWTRDRQPLGGEALRPVFSVSVVDDADDILSRLRGHRDIIRAREQAEQRASLVLPTGQVLPLAPSLAAEAAMLMSDAVGQAVCGPGADTRRWRGRPVTDLALLLFRDHLLKRMTADGGRA